MSIPSAQAAAPLLQCSGLSVSAGGHELVRDLSFTAAAGTVTCVLGRNGTGKTLTLHTFARLRASQGGTILLRGRELDTWPRSEFARQVALLTQDNEDPFPASVLETALIGRHPHIGFWEWENERDREIVRIALAAVGLGEFQARAVATLSGGERRRVALAAVLAQDPAILLLDEPTNHLDPHHQTGVLRLLQTLAADNRAIIMSLHDAGQAARFADHVLLLFGDGSWLHGKTSEVLTPDNVARLYQTEVRELTWPGGRTFVTL